MTDKKLQISVSVKDIPAIHALADGMRTLMETLSFAATELAKVDPNHPALEKILADAKTVDASLTSAFA